MTGDQTLGTLRTERGVTEATAIERFMESQVDENVVRSTLPPRRGDRHRERSSKYSNTEFYTSTVQKRKQRARKVRSRDQEMSNGSEEEARDAEVVLRAVDEADPYAIDNDRGALQEVRIP